jgi:hypothetical protein
LGSLRIDCGMTAESTEHEKKDEDDHQQAQYAS